MSLENLYPLPTAVNAPTSRSPEYQKRIYDLAEMHFTGHELQELRTRIPNIRFAIEEADLYKRYIVHQDRKLLSKLQHFVGSVYIYDLLTANLRELSDRVENATQPALITTSRAEMGKLANALRGYVAVECDDTGNTKITQAKANEKVYLSRIPHNIIANISTLEKQAAMTGVPGKGDSTIKALQSAGPMGSEAFGIRAFELAPQNVPSPTYLLDNHPADDCMPARLIYQLASSKIDCSYLSMDHRKRLSKLEIDFPPVTVNLPHPSAAKSYNVKAATMPGAYLDMGSGNGQINYGVDSAVQVTFRNDINAVTIGKGGGGDPPPLRYSTQVYFNPARSATDSLYQFDNVIASFIKRDIIAFNALRGQILDKIDVWWKRNGALASMTQTVPAGYADPIQFIQNIQKATYALTGSIPKCPKGSATVWYDKDPASDPKARIVDEFIMAADGTRVRNPFAKVGMCADEPFQADAMTGYPTTGYSVDPTGPHYQVNGARRYKRHSTAARRTRKPARRPARMFY
eukprot:jgi/Mesvir1/9145/Mv14395-RA.1